MAGLGTDKEFNLKCDIKVVNKSFYEKDDEAQHEATCVLLIPRKDNTETWKFFASWLPDTDEEHYEIPMALGHPIYGYCRGAVLRSAPECDQPHIFVMSAGVEDTLRKRKGSIDVLVLPEDQDEVCDRAQDISRTVKQT